MPRFQLTINEWVISWLPEGGWFFWCPNGSFFGEKYQNV